MELPPARTHRRPGLEALPRHDDVRRLGQPPTTTSRSAIIHARARRRHQLRRHRRRLLRRRVRGDRRQGAQGPARRRRARDEVLHARWATTPTGAAARGAGSSPAVENSLRRLGTDWIDLYQVHRPDPAVDVEETLGALTDLVTQGKVRYVGSSSYSGRRDRRGAVDRARAAPGALPHRAAAVLAARARHRDRRAADRAAPRHGHPHLQPALRRLAVGQLDARTAHPPRPRVSGWPRASTCRCRRTSASSRPSRSSRRSPTTPA